MSYTFETASAPKITRTVTREVNPFQDAVNGLKPGDGTSAIRFPVEGTNNKTGKGGNKELNKINRQLREAGDARPDGPVTVRMAVSDVEDGKFYVTFYAVPKIRQERKPKQAATPATAPKGAAKTK